MTKRLCVSLLTVIVFLTGVSSSFAEMINAVLNTPGSASDVAVEGSQAYVADSAGGLRIIDISNPSLPQEVSSAATPGVASGVALYGNYALVADGISGIQFFDISNPLSPQPYASLPMTGDALDIHIDSSYAYVAAGTAGLHIVSLHDMLAPYVLETFNTPGTAQEVTVIDDLAYVADGSGGLQLVDVGNPFVPTTIGTLTSASAVNWLSVAGDIVYLATQAEQLLLIDVSDPTLPVLIGTKTPEGQARSVVVAEPLSYVADHENGLRILSVAEQLPGKVISPNGGEMLIAGQSVLLEWSAVTGAQNYELSYTFGDGQWHGIATVSGVTTYSWQTPAIAQPEDRCRIRLKSYNASGGVIGDDPSDGVFTLSSSAGNVTSISAPANSASSSVVVSWSASSVPGVSYELNISKDGSPFEQIYQGGSLSVELAGLSNGTHSFKARAVRTDYIDGPWSSLATTLVDSVDGGSSGEACGMPSNITVPPESDSGQIAISWGASPTSGVTYSVELSANSGNTYSPVYVGTALSANIPVAAEGSYRFRIKASKSGLAGSSWALTSSCQTILGQPSNLTVTPTSSNGAIALSWVASNTPSVTYVIEMSNDGGSSYMGVYQGNGLSATVNVGSDGTFSFRIKAIKNNYTDTAWVSGGSCVVTLACGVPSSINVSANVSAQHFAVSWGASSTTGVVYVLERSSNGGSSYTGVYSGSSLSATVPVTASGSYRFRVKATKASMQDSSWRVSSDVPITLVADTVTITSPTTDSNGAYTVSWTGSQYSGATYVVEEAQNSSFTVALRTVASYTSSTSVAITGRADYATYYYRVKVAVSGMTNGGWSNIDSTQIVFPSLPSLSLSCGSCQDLWTGRSTSMRIYFNASSFPSGTTFSTANVSGCSVSIRSGYLIVSFSPITAWEFDFYAINPNYRGTAPKHVSGFADWGD